ncbi:MAG: class I SAM-dependent methyltransferase [bacterium]|nr:class I SAM-dependent methyltransferase [bacterium]
MNKLEKALDQIFTHLTRKEKVFLKHLAGKVPKDGVILEVGSYLGASACFFALGTKKPGQRIYCVDTWQNDAMSEGKRDTFAEFLKNTAYFKEKIIPLRGYSEDIARTFDKKIDLLFIDADHSYKGCNQDVKAWFPHLNPGAIVIFHDYGWAEGVQRTVKEFVKPIEKRSGVKVENTYWTVI